MNKIPTGSYCYDDNGACLHWRKNKRYKANMYGFGYVDSVWCDYLKINSSQLDFEGIYEKNGSKCIQAHYLNDMCKQCGINK